MTKCFYYIKSTRSMHSRVYLSLKVCNNKIYLFLRAICDKTKHFGHLDQWRMRFELIRILQENTSILCLKYMYLTVREK